MNALTVLKAHEKDLGGGFIVRRVLPALARQAVGPFLFFDHFGPIDEAPDVVHDVRAHPHIGLATVTYLFEGAILHRDSLGSVQRIEPGAINWMSAGRGIVHAERTPPDLIGKARRSHGLQLWAALPLAQEQGAPSFAHTPASAIPLLARSGATVRVLIGAAFGQVSPVVAMAGTLYLDIALDAGARLQLDALPPEAAIYPVAGSVTVDGITLEPGAMAVLAPGVAPTIVAQQAARCVVIGGEPLDGKRFIWWNFVSSDKERLLQAADDWEAGRMPEVPGETERIPAPKRASR